MDPATIWLKKLSPITLQKISSDRPLLLPGEGTSKDQSIAGILKSPTTILLDSLVLRSYELR